MTEMMKRKLQSGKWRARQLELPFESITPGALEIHWRTEGIDPDTCVYCYGPFEQLDHPHSLRREGSPGHVLTNIVPSCEPCNRAKHLKTSDEFIRESFYWRNKESAHV